jgi:hypothetical protein
MIHHIDLGSVLRDQVHARYGNLVTRPTGAQVRTCIEARLAALDDGTVTVLDFSNVGVLDFSCADEIVAKLTNGDGAGARLRFAGVTAGHLEAIEAVLERHGLMLAVEPAGAGAAGDAYRVVGAPLA